MLKFRSVTTSVFIFCLFLNQLSGCKEKTISTKLSCENDKTQCLKLANSKTEIRFNTPQLFSEQAYDVEVKTDKMINKAYLSGINMKMGRIPFLMEGTSTGYNGQIFLGMCSEPIMKWNLTVIYGDETVDVFEVTSYWNKEVYFNSMEGN